MSGLGGMMTAPNTVAPKVTAEPTGRWIIEDEEDYVTPPPEFWEDPFKMPVLNNRLVFWVENWVKSQAIFWRVVTNFVEAIIDYNGV